MIFLEDKTIKVGGVVLPGLVKKVEVTTTAAVDSIEVEGSAVSPKQAVGYEDGKVKIDLILGATANESLENKIIRLETIFRKKGQTIPQPMNIVSKATAAAKIDKVIFEQLTVTEDNKTNQATAALQFCEYIPLPIKAASTKSTSAKTPALTQSYQTYLERNRGSSPLDKTPSVDDRMIGPVVWERIGDYQNMLK